MHILLIEPDKVLARSYQSALEQAGCTVSWQHNVQNALNILDEHAIDTIVLELQLAKHNGVEFLHELRSYPEWNKIPVVLHTVVPQFNKGMGQSFWQQLGVASYLYKPQTTLKQLIYTVNHLADYSVAT